MGDDVREIEPRVKKKTRDDVKVFLIGCVGYSALEILWRGFTHWSMALTGGGCMVAIYELNCRHPQLPVSYTHLSSRWRRWRRFPTPQTLRPLLHGPA